MFLKLHMLVNLNVPCVLCKTTITSMDKQKMSDDIVTQCCDKASDCIQRGELDKAARYLKKATDRDPSNGRAIELLTIIAEKKRREEQNSTLRFRSFT